jgi:hypothetical protein
MRTLTAILLILLCFVGYADEINPPLEVSSIDGTVVTYPYKIKVTTAAIVDNGDGTTTLNMGGAGIETDPVYTVNAPLTYLQLNCGNDPLTAALDVYGMVSSYETGLAHADYVGIFHDGTDATIGTNAGQVKISPVTNIMSILPDAGGTYKHLFVDSGLNTVASIDSDGSISGRNFVVEASGTATAGVTTYNSGDINSVSSAWDTDDLVADTHKFKWRNESISGASTDATYHLYYQKNAAVESDIFSSDSAGILSINKAKVGALSSWTDFVNSQFIVSRNDLGISSAEIFGSVFEASASAAAMINGYGIYSAGMADGAYGGYGAKLSGKVTLTADAGDSVGAWGTATDTHAGGRNIAFLANASGGATNYSFYGDTGYLYNIQTIQSGANGTDGKFTLYSEQGTPDYTVSLNPNATMTSNADFYLPADEPIGTYLVTCSAGGVLAYDSNTYLTTGSAASTYLKLDQTSPQSVINGAPIFDSLDFDITPAAHVNTEGRLRWDETFHTLGIDIAEGSTIQVGQETMCYVYNDTISNITQGQVVYITGANAGIPTIGLADATDVTKSFVLGVVTTAIIEPTTYGYVTIRGHVNTLDTSAWTVGTSLYLSSTVPGALTSTAPSAGSYDVRVGRVMIQDVAVGRVYVNIRPMAQLTDLGDVTISTPTVDQVLRFNGIEWVNGAPVAASASPGIDFFVASPTLIASGTQNTIQLNTMSKIPVVTAEQTRAGTGSTGGTPIPFAAALYDTALGRTSIDAGIWEFHTWANINNAIGTTTWSKCVYAVLDEVGGSTVMVTTGGGDTTTSRTATSSGGTPFAAGKIDVGGTASTDSYLKTTKGLLRITSYVSDTVVKVATPSTYTDDVAGMAFSVWKKVVGSGNSADISTTTATGLYQSISLSVSAGSYAITALHKLGSISFVSSTASRTITTTYDGTLRNTNFSTPLITLHGNLAGLQGGTGAVPAEEYYHLTSAQHTIATQAANTTVSGYLSTTDWDTFNNKLSAEVDGSTTNEINTITTPDANVTAGLGITFAQAGIMGITESAPDTITFTATEVDGSVSNEINTITGDDSDTTSGLAISILGAGTVSTAVAGDTVTITGVSGATAWDDITDPDADTTIAMAGYETVFTSTLDEVNHIVFKIDNTDADLANLTYLQVLEFTDDEDASGIFFDCRDNDGDSVFSIGSGGLTRLGYADLRRGFFYLSGSVTGVYGGSMYIETGADHDGTINSYDFIVYEDDLYIGPDTNQDALKLSAGTNFAVTNGSLTATGLDASDSNITNVGNIALDSISSDAGTSVNVTLGSDAGDDFLVDTNALVVEGDNKRVGINITAPVETLHVYSTSYSTIKAHSNNDVEGTCPAFLMYHEDASGNTPINTILGSIQFRGDSVNETSGASINAYAAEEWGTGGDTSDTPSYLTFSTSPDGGSETERVRITKEGYVTIGSSNTHNRLTVEENRAGYAVSIYNDGDNANRHGILVQCGADNGSGTTYYLVGADGNGDGVGVIQNESGTFKLTDWSDIATKKNVVDTKIEGIKTIKDIKVREFERLNDSGKKINGFVAQELQPVYSKAVSVMPDGLLGVSKSELVPVLVKAIQEQQVIIEDLTKRIEALEKK